MAGGTRLSRTKRAVDLVRQGMSQAEAARTVGISRSAVSEEATKQGLRGVTEAGLAAMNAARRAQWRDPQFRANVAEAVRRSAAFYRAQIGVPDPLEILRQHEAGATYRQIADKYLMTQKQVAEYARRARKGVYSSSGSPR